MKYIQSREYFSRGDTVVVDCDHQCNVVILDDANFNLYKEGRSFTHRGGGHYKRFPARISVPQSGHWNVVLDLAGREANIRYNMRVIRAAA